MQTGTFRWVDCLILIPRTEDCTLTHTGAYPLFFFVLKKKVVAIIKFHI